MVILRLVLYPNSMHNMLLPELVPELPSQAPMEGCNCLRLTSRHDNFDNSCSSALYGRHRLVFCTTSKAFNMPDYVSGPEYNAAVIDTLCRGSL